MKQDAGTSRRVRLQGILLLLVVFIVGALAGGATERALVSPDPPPRPFRQPDGELPPPFLRLDLTEEQRSQIRGVFERARPRAESIMRELMPQLAEINDSVRQEIRNILTPEQAEELQEEYERRGMFRGGRFWPGGPFPPDSPPGRRQRPPPPER